MLEFTFSLSGVSRFDLDLPVHYQNSYGDEYFKLDDELSNLLSLDELCFLKGLSSLVYVHFSVGLEFSPCLRELELL